ncbi:hypothetical protein VTG60DRAFT_3173 [Thermothelomyces hinnuleus]
MKPALRDTISRRAASAEHRYSVLASVVQRIPSNKGRRLCMRDHKVHPRYECVAALRNERANIHKKTPFSSGFL